MKVLLWIFRLFFVLGVFGIFGNVYTGLSLSKDAAAASDFHLTVALASIVLLVVASLGNIQISQQLLGALQERVLLSKKKSPSGLEILTNARTKAVSFSIFMIVCCVINVISGTVSQTGRFPLIHGVFGFSLLGLAVTTLTFWTYFFVRLFGFEKQI